MLKINDYQTGDEFICEVVSEVELTQNAKLLRVNHPDLSEMAIVVYDSGEYFTQWDWTDKHIKTAEDVSAGKWVFMDGREAIMLDGLPRVF